MCEPLTALTLNPEESNIGLIRDAFEQVLESDEIMRSRPLVDVIIKRIATYDANSKEKIPITLHQVISRFLEMRLGTPESRDEHGEGLLNQLKLQVEASPYLKERYTANIEKARQIVGSLAPIHATKPSSAKRMSETEDRRLFSAFHFQKQNHQETNTFYFDTLLGLDMMTFFSIGFPSRSYGLYAFVGQPSLLCGDVCMVSFDEFSHQLDHPVTTTGEQVRLKYGTLRPSRGDEQDEDKKILLAAFELEALKYKEKLVSGKTYLEILSLVFAISGLDISFDSLASLEPVFTRTEISLESTDPVRLLSFLMNAEIKFIAPDEQGTRISKIVIPDSAIDNFPDSGATVPYKYGFMDSLAEQRSKFADALYSENSQPHA